MEEAEKPVGNAEALVEEVEEPVGKAEESVEQTEEFNHAVTQPAAFKGSNGAECMAADVSPSLPMLDDYATASNESPVGHACPR